MKRYSFIIPHKNSLRTLQRLLNSIPRRDDVQIVIVDDNSDSVVVDELKQMVFNEKCIELYLTQDGKGAGRARNVGLKYAKGEWILFADADDFYSSNALLIFDSHCYDNVDVLYFGINTLDGETLKPLDFYPYVNDALENTSWDEIKYGCNPPWFKMIRKDLIDNCKLRFEEIPIGNDVMFSCLLGFYARSVGKETMKLYNYTKNTKGLSYSKRSVESLLINFQNLKKKNNFLKYIRSTCRREPAYHYILHCIRWYGIRKTISMMLKYIANYKHNKKMELNYIRIIAHDKYV